ncbi:MAG: hypothetical protein FH756_17070 [Firmicutes bacterium]|nr:hypothetical protein [Bacillota bacterium]
MDHFTPLIVLLLTGYLINIPLGFWRSRTRKFSPGWFLAIHLSIPLIYYLRVDWNIGAHYIPLLATGLVMGQVMGDNYHRLRRR